MMSCCSAFVVEQLLISCYYHLIGLPQTSFRQDVASQASQYH
jgi:hypothetical protein